MKYALALITILVATPAFAGKCLLTDGDCPSITYDSNGTNTVSAGNDIITPNVGGQNPPDINDGYGSELIDNPNVGNVDTGGVPGRNGND